MEDNKKKKKLLFILIPVLAVLLAGGLIVGLNAKNWFGQESGTEDGTETEPPTEITDATDEPGDEPYDGEQLPIYYNVDLVYYMGMSEGGLSSRKKEDDGYYHFLMSVEGVRKTLKTTETRIMNFLDSRAFSCIKADEDGVILEVYDPEKCNYSSLMEEVWIFAATDTTLTVNTEEFFGGFTYAVTDKNGFLAYDTSNEEEPVPEVVLAKGEKISIFRYRPTKQTYVYRYPAGIPATQRFYWNVSRKWNADIQNTTREPNEQGIYEIEMANNGELCTVKVKDRDLVVQIDQNAGRCFVLSFDKDGFVTKVQTAPVGAGGTTLASWFHVMEFLNAEETEFHARKTSTTAADYGKEVDVTIAPDCQIYNVSAYVDDHVGEVAKLRVGDQVHCVKKDGVAILIYIVNRKFDSKPYWNVSRKYDSTNKTTTRTPNAAGFYEFVMAVEGRQITVRTADKALATKIDSATFCGLKLEGDIVTEVYLSASSSLLDHYGAQASWYDIMEFLSKDQREFKAKRTIAGAELGKSCAVTMADNCQVYNVSSVYDSYVGEPGQVRLGDRIHVVLDEYAKAKLIYIVTRFVDADIYWNVTRKYANGATTRTAAEDGYYYFDMAVNGKKVEVRATKELADKMDSYAVKNMGLHLQADGKTVAKVYSSSAVKSTAGGSTSSWCDILTLSSTQFKSQKIDDPKSSYYLKEYTVNYNSATKVYNCSGFYDTDGTHFIGEKTTLRLGDKVHVLLNRDQVAAVIFVVARSYPVTAHKDSHNCPDCNQKVEWTPWQKTTTLPTTAGHYYLCGNVKLTGGTVSAANENIVICLNGYTVDSATTSRIYTTSGEGSSVTIIGTEKGSKLIGHYHGKATAGPVLFSYKGDMKVFGGVIDASDVVTEDKASALFTYSGVRFELHDVEIIGGTAATRGVISSNGGCELVLDNVKMTGGDATADKCILYAVAGSSTTLKGALEFDKIPEGSAAIRMESGAKLTLDGLTSAKNATVRMTGGTGVFTTNYEDGAEDLFTAADAQYVIGYGDGKALELAAGYATDISLALPEVNFRQLQTGSLGAAVVPAKAANRILVYESSDPDLIAVDENGSLKAFRKEGTATITVKTADGKVSKTVNVTVSGEPVAATSITLNETELSLYLGASAALTATFTPAEAFYLTASYVSSAPDVVSVDENGTVTALKAGTAVITATPERGDCEATCTVMVTAHEHTVCGKAGCTEEGHDHSSPAWQPWTDGTKVPDTDGYWYLATDVTVSKETVLAGRKIVLDLAGHKITATSKIYHITAASELTITDCQESGSIVLTGDAHMLNQRGGSKVTIYGGTLDATGANGSYGTILYMHDDGGNETVMYGGTLKGGHGVNAGGAFFLGGKTVFTMKGGTIVGGTAPKGGAITSYAKVFIEGGTIIGGSAESNGGAICMDSATSELTMTGGRIEGGHADNAGGNVYSLGTVNLSDGVIAGGTAKSAGNVFTSKLLNMTSGSIEGGTALNYGGNVLLNGAASVFTMSGGEVKDGKLNATSFATGGNISITSGKFEMTGGKVTNGDAGNYYGGNIATDGSGAQLLLTGGEISGGKAGRDGGNLYIHTNTNKDTYKNTAVIAGTVVISGGETKASGGNIILDKQSELTIAGNAVIKDGVGAVYAGNIKMAAGTSAVMKENALISGGKGRHGGNVMMEAGCSFLMESGTIENGTATAVGSDGGFGGNVSVRGVFTMEGGTISGGKCVGNTGGNIALWQTDSRLVMSGGLITGGEREGSIREGGVSVFYNAKSDDMFVMTGGEISGNVGGVYMSTGKIQLSGSAVIRDNGTHNLYSASADRITLGNALTEGAEIHVTVPENTLFAASETDYRNYFKADDTAYEVVYDSVNKGHKLARDYSNMKLDIYMLAGQSNASGSSSVANGEENGVRDKNTYENVRYYYYRTNTNGTVVQDRRTLEAVKEGMGYTNGYIGPELGMAAYLNALYEDADKEALIFKYAAGGTSLIRYTDENGVIQNSSAQTGTSVDRYNERGSWYPESKLPEAVKALVAADPNLPSGYLTRGFKAEIAVLYDKLLTMGYKPENIRFVTLTWMQGGEDRTMPEVYGELFKAFAGEIRDKVSEVTGQDYSKLPIVVGEISETFSSATASSVATNRAFIEMQDGLPGLVDDVYVVPSRSFVMNKLVDGQSVACGTDNAHFSYKDCLAFGQMVAEMSYIATNDTSELHMHCICGSGTMTAGEHAHAALLWKEWSDASKLPEESGNWFLTTDVTLSAQTNLAGKSVNLCLNGHTVNSTSKVFHLTAGSTLKITDCQTGGTIKETGTFANDAGNGIFNVRGGSKIELYAGTIDASGVTTGYGPVAYVNGDAGDEVSIYGGTLKGGTGLSISGGIYLGNIGQFNMHGGVLEGGVGPRGGSLHCVGNFLMTGGTITGGQTAANPNTTDAGLDRMGGNIYFPGAGRTFIMTGGTITSGKTQTLTNSNDLGGNLAIVGSGCTVRISGGEISWGEANCGGNIYIRSSSTTKWQDVEFSGGVITDGFAQSIGGNVELRQYVYFHMTGGELLNGYAKNTNAGQISTRGAIARISDGTIGVPKSVDGAASKGQPLAMQVDGTSKIAGVFLIEGGTVPGIQSTSTGGSLTYGGETYKGGLTRITGGTVASATIYNGSIEVRGGTVGLVSANGNTGATATVGDADIYGGYVKTLTKTNAGKSTIHIYGGTFVSNPTTWLASGYQAESGDFTNTEDTSDTTVYKFKVTPAN